MKITWPYVAGFFDGEGCLGIYPQKESKYWAVRVEFTQSEPQEKVLYEIQEFLAECGINFTIKSRPGSGNRQTCYKLYTVNRRVASEFLQGVEPYLRVKRRKAKEFIAWAEANPSRRGNKRRPIKKSKVNEILRLSEEGMTQTQIAVRLGVSNQVMVGRILRRSRSSLSTV